MPGTYVLTAKAGAQTLGNQVDIEFLDISQIHSHVNVSKREVRADGQDYAEMEVTLRDRLVRPYTHVHVRLVPETGSPLIEADRMSTRLKSSYVANSYAVFCL